VVTSGKSILVTLNVESVQSQKKRLQINPEELRFHRDHQTANGRMSLTNLLF
jgi:hypothetical protein